MPHPRIKGLPLMAIVGRLTCRAFGHQPAVSEAYLWPGRTVSVPPYCPRCLTPSDASLLDPSMELDTDLYEAILAAFRGTLPEGCINFPMTGTVAFAAAQAAQRFYADRAVRTMLR